MERQSSNEKYCIAWFKLAECVSRKEKERAFGVYRLLAHSIGDEALAMQLEGDLLLSFDDAAAIAKYKQAVELYQKKERFAPAIGICEHIVFLHPQDIWTLKRLVDLYQKMGITSKVKETQKKLQNI